MTKNLIRTQFVAEDITYEWGSGRLLVEEILSDLTLKDVDLGDGVNVLISQSSISGLLTD